MSVHIYKVPSITNYDMAGHSYRYYKGDPLYPFGYGLSYTTFLYMMTSVEPTNIHGGQNVNVTVGVFNSGNVDTDEVSEMAHLFLLLTGDDKD